MKRKEDQDLHRDSAGRIIPAQAFHVPQGVKYLDTLQLSAYAQAFQNWHKNTPGQSTRRARGRVWLTYLVLRFTGAKLGETLALDDREDLDLDQCLIRFNSGHPEEREVQLPWEVVQEINTFWEDPENARLRGILFRMDQGHVRRKFQEVGALCGLPKELSNPAVLRRSRAIELLRSDIPLKIVQRILGQGTANLAANLLEFSDDEVKQIVGLHIHKENTRKMSARNSFFGKITHIEVGDIQSEVELTVIGGYQVVTVITNGSLKSMGLKKGMYVTAIVKAPWVVLSKSDSSPTTSARNKFLGKTVEIKRGKITSEVTIEIPGGVSVCSIITRESLKNLDLRLGDQVWALFKTSAVVLLLE